MMSSFSRLTACAALLYGGGIAVEKSDALMPSAPTPRTHSRSHPSSSQRAFGVRLYSSADDDATTLSVAVESASTSQSSSSAQTQQDDDDIMVKSAQEIINGFVPGTFRPHPAFTNLHVQTIVGALFRKSTMYWDEETDDWFSLLGRMLSSSDEKENGNNSDSEDDDDDSFIAWDERERVSTPDGDFFDVDWKYCGAGSPCRGTVVLTHGLESGSDKPLSRDLGTAYHLRGFDVAYLNFRGCSGEPNLTPAAYHLSFTDDLEYFLTLKKESFNGPVFLSGFSLGANVVVNFLAQAGLSITEKYNVRGAAVNSCPLEVTKTSVNLNGPENFFSFNVYGRDLLRKLAGKAAAQARNPAIDCPFSAEDVERCMTINEMEDAVICPVYGFEDAQDYHERSSVAGKLDRVAVPLYVVNAEDDPFLMGDARPSSSFAKTTKFLFTDLGGHCGNVFHTGPKAPATVGDDGRMIQSSWMPVELARFVSHVADAGPSSVESIEL